MQGSFVGFFYFSIILVTISFPTLKIRNQLTSAPLLSFMPAANIIPQKNFLKSPFLLLAASFLMREFYYCNMFKSKCLCER